MRTDGDSIAGERTVARPSSESMTAGNGSWCTPDAHPGYINWDRYQENLRVVATNGHGYEVARQSPPREAFGRSGRDVRCVDGAADTSACDTRRGAADWSRGTSAIRVSCAWGTIRAN